MAENLSIVIDFEESVGDLGQPGVPGSTSNDKFCDVCYLFKSSKDFVQFSNCGHEFCSECVTRVFEANIMESRVDMQCLKCAGAVSQVEVKQVVNLEHFEKFLSFSIRKYLATQEQRSVCYCLSPNCPFACINTSSESSSDPERNHFVCRREECRSEYCNACKRAWHPGKTCRELAGESTGASMGLSEELKASMGTKNCPSCNAIIQKTSDDGSCNQVVCTVCKTSFCWLCGKPVTEMHYMSPTGCPLYGNQMWTRRKKWGCRLCLWFTAPILTILLALVVIPIILIVLPLGVGYKVYKSSTKAECPKVFRIAVTVMAVGVCVVLAPLVAFLASLLTFPLALLYFYCFIPIHVCAQSSPTV